jgi:hypothetical protein
MTRSELWFRRVVLLGVLGNWTFAAAVFINPNALLAFLKLGPVPSTVWLFNYSVLLTLLSCFYVPAAYRPYRYRVNCWLLVLCRLIPATTFFEGVYLSYMPGGFLMLGIGDASVGVTEAILLVLLLRHKESSVD